MADRQAVPRDHRVATAPSAFFPAPVAPDDGGLILSGPAAPPDCTGAVLVYVHDLRASGVVRNAIAIAERIGRERPTILLAGYAEGLFAAGLGRLSCGVRALRRGPPPARWARARLVPPLRALIGAEPPALIISAGKFGHATVMAAAAGRRAPPRLYMMTNAMERRGRLDTWRKGVLARAQLADAARVTMVSGTVAAAPVFRRALSEGRAEIVPNGIDVAAARAAALAPAPHPWFDQDVPVVLGIGRLQPQKNFALLVEAVALLRRRRRVRLAILGGGPAAAADRLSDQAATAALGDDFLLAGEVANIYAWAARSAVFALPSMWEGSSVALLEAMAVGVPVVATRQAGDAVHVLDDGRFGLLVDAGDPQALADALERQLGPDRVLPGERATAFSLERMLNRYAELATELAGPALSS